MTAAKRVQLKGGSDYLCQTSCSLWGQQELQLHLSIQVEDFAKMRAIEVLLHFISTQVTKSACVR